MKTSLLFFIFLTGCWKSKDPEPSSYKPASIEWDEDIDLDDLPEADDTGDYESIR